MTKAGPFERMDDAALGIENRRNDGWANVITGLGMWNRDKRMSARMVPDAQLPFMELENLFHGDDVVKRICELVPREMTREWIEISGDPDNKVGAKLEQLNARAAFKEGQVWGRLYGGAICIMGVNDGQTFDKPLNIDAVKSIDWLTVLDRWDVQILTRYADPTQGNFDQPETYRVVTSAVVLPGAVSGAQNAAQTTGLEAIIHESRVLRFDGTLTGRRRKRFNLNGWSESVIDAAYPIVRDFNSAFGSVSNMMTDFSQAVMKIKNLAQMLASDKDALVIKRMKMLDMSRSVARAVMLDADGEEFDRNTLSFSGVAEILDRIGQRLSAATDIPMTLLMGESPAGMNATGEGDHRFFYNVIKDQQETRFRSPLVRLLSIIAKVVGVKPSDENTGSMSFQFRSLWQESESEKEDTRLKVAQRDQIYYTMGGLDAAEIIVSRFGGDKYSTETTIDLKGQLPAKNIGDIDPDETDDEDPAAASSGSGAAKGAATDNVQNTALNGAQVTALQGLLASVADGTLKGSAAIIAIKLSFPAFDETQVTKMVSAIEVKEKQDPPPMVPGMMPHPGVMPPAAPPTKPGAVPDAKDPKKEDAP